MTLFDAALDEVLADTGGRVRATDPETSQSAAKTVKAGTHRGQVLIALADAGERGLTGHEAWAVTDCAYPASATTRLEELEAVFFAARTDRTRATATGCQAIVFVATALGRERAAEIRQ